MLAACPSGLIVSTCGTSEFDAVVDVRARSTDAAPLACSAEADGCTGAALGAVVRADVAAGLTFVVVDGRNDAAVGHYQMSIVY